MKKIFLQIYTLVGPFFPLIISCRWRWWEAWVFAIICLIAYIINGLVVAKIHPELISERARFTKHEDIAPWDKTLVTLIVIGGGLIPIAAGLDALFHWSIPFQVSIKIMSLFVFLAGILLGMYAMITNQFFSSVVRIQSDRGHYPVAKGPYRWVRHPGYAGGLMVYLTIPFFLDSTLALFPAGLLASLFIIRTRLEDRLLITELAGYQKYMRQVRYRLVPGIW